MSTYIPVLATEDVDPTDWSSVESHFATLRAVELNQQSVSAWLADWSHLADVVAEATTIVDVQTTLDTRDEATQQTFQKMLNNFYPPLMQENQALKTKLLDSTFDPSDIEIMMRNMRNEADLFREANVALETKLRQLSNQYDSELGGMLIKWSDDEAELNLSQLTPYLTSTNRDTRERAYRLMADAWQSYRERINKLFLEMLPLRDEMARNAGCSDYRDFRFRQLGRLAYTPADCKTFHDAIEAAVVPYAAEIMAAKQAVMGVDEIRPWDWIPEMGLTCNTTSGDDLKPFSTEEELIQRSLAIFNQIDPELGRYFATMAEEEVLDLETRPGKMMGGYCDSFPLRKQPFIFMNAIGIHSDVQTMLHEAGHAFHYVESVNKQRYHWQHHPPMEFAEVASMSMELLSAPFLTQDNGGFYTERDAARARIEHLEHTILFFPYMAVVDAFQHEVYTRPAPITDSAELDAIWDALWQRFLPGINYAGFEGVRASGWQRKPHIAVVPFYYIEYGMASVGALQIWRQSLQDPAGALSRYRHALSLGGTQPLPALFEAAGIEFRFDTEMLSSLVALVKETLDELTQSL